MKSAPGYISQGFLNKHTRGRGGGTAGAGGKRKPTYQTEGSSTKKQKIEFSVNSQYPFQISVCGDIDLQQLPDRDTVWQHLDKLVIEAKKPKPFQEEIYPRIKRTGPPPTILEQRTVAV